MTLKLFFAPGACSFVPHAMLELAGAAFEPVSVKLHKGEQRSAEYLALNPRGQVPVLPVLALFKGGHAVLDRRRHGVETGAQAADLVPVVDPTGLYGALFDPEEGNLDPNVLFAPPDQIRAEVTRSLESFGTPTAQSGPVDVYVDVVGAVAEAGFALLATTTGTASAPVVALAATAAVASSTGTGTGMVPDIGTCGTGGRTMSAMHKPDAPTPA